eukprot:scaffold139957_cov93-Phaeocystis_antarctica.AAC.2
MAEASYNSLACRAMRVVLASLPRVEPVVLGKLAYECGGFGPSSPARGTPVVVVEEAGDLEQAGDQPSHRDTNVRGGAVVVSVAYAVLDEVPHELGEVFVGDCRRHLRGARGGARLGRGWFAAWSG